MNSFLTYRCNWNCRICFGSEFHSWPGHINIGSGTLPNLSTLLSLPGSSFTEDSPTRNKTKARQDSQLGVDWLDSTSAPWDLFSVFSKERKSRFQSYPLVFGIPFHIEYGLIPGKVLPEWIEKVSPHYALTRRIPNMGQLREDLLS